MTDASFRLTGATEEVRNDSPVIGEFLERGHFKTAAVLAVLRELRPYILAVVVVVGGSPFAEFLLNRF